MTARMIPDDPRLREKRLRAFFQKVHIPADKTACWHWIGAKFSNGYGRFWIGGRHAMTHRFMMEVQNGPIPDGMFVCHRCDNPPCCNPEHLFLGTPLDNTRDAIEKGRAWHPSGERHCRAKFSDETIAMIRRLHKDEGISQAQLCQQFGVSSAHMNNIVHRRNRS